MTRARDVANIDGVLTTKGDIYAATAAATPARLAVGNNGETLVADSSASVGIRYQANFAAGKNKIINGDFGIWQRGTSFTNVYPGLVTCDRWYTAGAETTGSNITQSTFATGTAPVAGYEGQYFLTFVKGGTAADKMALQQRIEDVRTFAGQTVTISYWMKASAAITNEPFIQQYFGTGGSAEVYTLTSTHAVTTSWARYSVTVAVPSISGKTVGANSFAGFVPLRYAGTSNVTIDIWGVQVEAGSVATAFQTATGTLQGELAACQRYYSKGDGDLSFSGTTTAGNGYYGFYYFPVDMRIAPTVVFTNANNAGPFGATPGGAGGTTTRYTREGRTAATTSSGYFGSSFTASAEL